MKASAATLRRAGRLDEAIGLVAGVVFTVALLAGLAHFGDRRSEPPAEIEVLRPIAMPLEAPPPPATETMHEPEEVAAPLIGIEAEASDSAVKIAVLPPDLQSLFPASAAPAAAIIQPLQAYSDLKPRFDVSGDISHVFQAAEVDQPPSVLRRPTPVIPSQVRNHAASLRVTTLIVVDSTGGVMSVRVAKSSGNPEFDDIILHSIQDDWLFTPAVRKGKKVRCLIQQAVYVRWPTPSPFSV